MYLGILDAGSHYQCATNGVGGRGQTPLLRIVKMRKSKIQHDKYILFIYSKTQSQKNLEFKS